MTESSKLATEAVGQLLKIEQKSGLPTKGFWKAVLVIAKSDPLLRAALQRGTYTNGHVDPVNASKPIVTDNESLIFETPK